MLLQVFYLAIIAKIVLFRRRCTVARVEVLVVGLMCQVFHELLNMHRANMTRNHMVYNYTILALNGILVNSGC